jgi:predicted nucleic acid-binding protein
MEAIVILLDTNYLIRGLIPGSREADDLMRWTRMGERMAVSTVVWYEFLCGPVTKPQQAAVRAFLDEILPFDEAQAEEASRLFNAVGRQRAVRVDAMIAAAALIARARLATSNREDFAPFVAEGMELA